MEKPYINCFTGAILHTLDNPHVHESDLMLLGKGYLLRSGYDEYGLPEITFPVQQCGERALEKLGVGFQHYSLNGTPDFSELARLCRQNSNGLVAWTNSAHLAYSSLYSINLGYLHSIVIKKVEGQVMHIFDPLVVDIPPYATFGELSFDQAKMAFTDIVKTDNDNLMGTLLLVEPSPDVCLQKTEKLQGMASLAHEFFQNDIFFQQKNK